MDEEYREIPDYKEYGVTKSGQIKSFKRDLILNQYVLNDYLIVDTFRGSKTETLPVHRAVALAWVKNPEPDKFDIVNHLDGKPFNNWYENLEWTDHSGNNYHAVNTGLRSDNIRCKVRNYFTKEITEFSSMTQAAEFMGFSKNSSISYLRPKLFGKLVNDEFEFRFENDPTPWFYETRELLTRPTRYIVTVSGHDKEFYNGAELLREFQLYDSPSKSMPGLVEFAKKKLPQLEFSIRDSYEEGIYRVTRNTKESKIVPVEAKKDVFTLYFRSLTQCARFFNVDRSSITSRLNNGEQLDEWTFSLTMPV